MSVLKDIMPYMRKHKLAAAYPAELGAVKSHLDQVLTTAYTQMKSKGFSPVQYWSSHKKWAELVCPVATIERLLIVQGSWAGHYDAILLDVDNGPIAMVQDGNARLYQAQGFAAITHALKPKGRVTFWSASQDTAFEKRLSKAGFKVDAVAVKAYPQARRCSHTIFVADRKD